MSWPLASHFSATLQNPRIAFRDPRLQSASIEKNGQNQPRPWAGAFAVVYKGIDPSGQQPFAVRVFTTESPERRDRYDLIGSYLQGRKLRCLVDFEYRDRGIRSAGDGKWYPLILMEWVQGETLFNWLAARCLEGHREAIAQIADRWLEAVQELADNSIAHGDLQHANVMVTPAWQIKLVDYDGMCVPSLVGRRNLEVGVEPYQHRERGASTLLSLDLDNFSALVIYVALRALSIQPGLWQKYVEQMGYDKLLFRREDFHAPGQSQLYYDLMQLGNSDLCGVVEKLFGLWHSRMEEVPPLGHLANSYAEVERLLAAQQWAAAVDLLNRRGHFRDAPARLQRPIYLAYEHVCRQQAWTKFSRIPTEASDEIDRQLVDAWNESLFANYPPAERQRARVAEARQRVQLLDRLRHLIQRTAGTISLSGEKGLAAIAANLPSGYRHALQERVTLAMRRLRAFTKLEKALKADSNDAAIVAAWQSVVKAQCEQFVSIEWGMRIAVAEERLPVFRALSKLTSSMPAGERDQKILAVWKEKLMANCREADKWRPLYQLAAVRREVLKRLRASIDARDDAAIVQWGAKHCLANYPLPPVTADAVAAARERVGNAESLLAALNSSMESENGANGASHMEVPHGFATQFDSRAVRSQAERFAPYQTLLAQWVRSDVLPLDKLGLSPPPEEPALSPADEPEDGLRAVWKWPDSRLSEECILAVCPTEPKPGDDPEQLSAHWRENVSAAKWAANGAGRLIPVEKSWEGSSVAVWAVVDLGPRKLYSPPLVLGQIETPFSVEVAAAVRPAERIRGNDVKGIMYRAPYTQSISRQNKACFLFLLDQSFSMEEPLGNSSNRKCDELVAAINGWLQNMAIRASGDEGIKDWMDIGVFGYRTDQQANPIIESALQGPLAGRTLVSIPEIGAAPARIDTRMQYLPDEETGEIFQVPCEMPVWVDPRAEGGTPMCHMLYYAHQLLSEWIVRHPRSFPPIVVHITDGESQDGSPIPYADALKALATEDGNVLFFNCHLSMTAADPFMFPSSDMGLPDELARALFHMSSVLPEPFLRHAQAEGFPIQPNARGMAFNADMVCLIQFLNMGTQAAPGLR